VSFHNDPWETPDAFERDAPDRWERLDQRDREDEAAQDRLTRDMPTRTLSERVTTRGRVDSHTARPRSESVPRPDYDPRVDHPERYMRDGVWQVDV
jgi:hypothetical protein